MRVSAAKSDANRLDRSVQRRVDQTKTRINFAAETRNPAQSARQVPELLHSGPTGLIGVRNGCNMQQKVFYLGNVG